MSRALVVGWDGGTWSVADPMARAGRLPVLTSLREGGAEGVLESVPNMNSAPAWSTIATGLNPGRHGIFYFDERVSGTYGRSIINAQRRSGPTMWRTASEAGKRVVVVNVPISYPAEEVNGFLVAGLDTPAKSLPGFAWPRDLTRRYTDLFRHYVVEPQAPTLMRDGRAKEAEHALLASVDGWTELTSRLMQDEEWDLVFVVFTSTDTTCHFFWNNEDNAVVERVYEVQDEATGRLIELARSQDPDVNVMVLADHGGAANTRGPEFMQTWLEDQGLMATAERSRASRSTVALFNLINRKLTREQKKALARWLPRLKERAEAESRLGGIDWTRTRAFADGVRDDVLVNLQGREPQGTVPPDGYGAFVEEMKERLGAIRELDTDRPAVEAVLHRDDVYEGEHVARAPDFTMRWVIDGTPFRGFRCETARGAERMREIAARPPFQPGGHHPDGMFVAKGPNFEGGHVRGGLADVAPTILTLIGVPLPARLDGKPLDTLRGVEVHVAGADAASASATVENGSGYTPQEEEAIRQRLEDLGYI